MIRELRKSGRFKAGESLDTVKVKNVAVDVSKKPKDQRTEVEKAQARNEFYDKPPAIVGALKQSGLPESDPFANVTGDSEKYRVIADSVSSDGRYAIALGLPDGKTDWEEYRDKELEEEGHEIYTVEEEGHQNYVVDLATRKILGTTGGDYFGTKQRYNHRECAVVWSPDCKNFVELTSDKWNYHSCHAGRIVAGPKLLGMVEVGKYAEKASSNYVKAHKKHNDDEGSIAIYVSEVGNDGLIKLEVIDQISGGERKGDVNSSVDEQLRLRETRLACVSKPSAFATRRKSKRRQFPRLSSAAQSWFKLHRALEIFGRAGFVAFCFFSHAAVVISVCVFRVDLDRAIVIRNRAIQIVRVRFCVAAIVISVHRDRPLSLC